MLPEMHLEANQGMRGRWRIAIVSFGSSRAQYFATVAEAENYCKRQNIDLGQISKWYVSGPRYKAQLLSELQAFEGFFIADFLTRL